MPGVSLGLDLGLIEANLRNSIAPKTWEEYTQAWSRWCFFCSTANRSVESVSAYTALCFVSFLIQENLSPASVNKILAGASFFLKFAGCPSLTSFFPVKQVLKGFKKSTPVLDKRRPISSDLLVKLISVLEVVCFSPYEVLLFKTVFVIAFFGAFRVGEMVAPNKVSASFLRFSDVLVVGDSVRIFLRRSKTDQSGRGRWVTLYIAPSGVICPVFWVSQYLLVRPPGSGSFFIHLDLSPLTRFQFSAVLSSCLKRLNLSGFRFSSHSFRIGAATEASLLGFSNDSLKKLGRWDSNRFKLYVRPDLIVS